MLSLVQVREGPRLVSGKLGLSKKSPSFINKSKYSDSHPIRFASRMALLQKKNLSTSWHSRECYPGISHLCITTVSTIFWAHKNMGPWKTHSKQQGWQNLFHPSSTSISARHVVLPESWGFCDDANSPSTWNERAWREHRNMYMPLVPQLENNLWTAQLPQRPPKPIAKF